jgi:hypothetical protein
MTTIDASVRVLAFYFAAVRAAKYFYCHFAQLVIKRCCARTVAKFFPPDIFNFLMVVDTNDFFAVQTMDRVLIVTL